MILNIDSLAIIGNNGLTKNVCEAGNTNFRATYRSSGMETVAWQYRVSPTDPWLSAASLGTVDAPAIPATGKNTRLSLTNVPLTYDPYEFRAYITLGNCKDSLAFILNVNEGGTVNAGLDQTICVVGNSADLTGTLTGGYEGIATTWSAAIGSDGTFSSTSMLATTFTPGTTDISNGSVDLYLVTNSLPGCGVKRDTVTIATVANVGMLYAGPDANVCAGSPFNVAGNICAPFSPVTSATWTSTGTEQHEKFLKYRITFRKHHMESSMPLSIAVARERTTGESRVALVPETAKKFTALGARLRMEQCAGTESHFLDSD